MPFVFLYLLKLSVSLLVVFLFYYGILRKLTFYNHNRWYLLGYTMLSFLIPLINISPVLEKNNWSNTTAVRWIPVIDGKQGTGISSPAAAFSAWDILLLVITTGMIIMLVRLVIQLFSFRRLLQKAVPLTAAGMKVYEVPGNIIPFSFGNSIFINSGLHTEEELKEIIHHEFIHVKQKHSLDIIWSELLCLLNWYNPFAWMLKKAIRQNLEFIADHKVLEKGTNKKEYQYLLLKVTGHNQYSIATPFNFSSLKKRIAMMNKTKSAKRQLGRLLFLLPATAVLLVAFRSKWNSPSSSIANDKLVTVAGPVAAPTTMQPQPKVYYSKDTVPGRQAPPPLPAIPVTPEAATDLVAPEAPATPATPATPAEPVKLPSHIKGISVHNDKVTVQLKNGTKENYDLSIPAQKESFEKKYGKLLPPPPPPPPPARQSAGIAVDASETGIIERPVVTDIRYSPGRKTTPRAIAGNPLVIVDGVLTTKAALADIKPEVIASVDVLKGSKAIAAYGQPAKDGAVIITTRAGAGYSNDLTTAGSEGAGSAAGTVGVTGPARVENALIVNSPGIEMKNSKQLVILDGKELSLDQKTFKGSFNITSLSKEEAMKKYGEKGKNGAMILTTIKE